MQVRRQSAISDGDLATVISLAGPMLVHPGLLSRRQLVIGTIRPSLRYASRATGRKAFNDFRKGSAHSIW
jgi:hypothetical protein